MSGRLPHPANPEMVFNSLLFVAFIGVVLIVSRSSLGWSVRKGFLTAASYAFYAAWNPLFCLLILFSTLVDWRIGLKLEASERPGLRKSLVTISLAVNLGLLGVFKYGQFLTDNSIALANAVGLDFQPVDLGILLPVGISFYTFQTLSYTLDVYRKRIPATQSLNDFALFVAFFPQLVAGPIVRAADFLPQLKGEKRATPQQFGWGITLLTLGLFQKVVLADHLMAPVVDRIYAPTFDANGVAAWVGTLAFAGQIFYDFAGYSLCAIGVALMLGFALPDNFKRPYGALGFSDFWRRWHITLSSWLRDYLYISLGGNRSGVIKMYRNLCVTMLLGGLWHGASWNFVIWGALHGAFLVVERLLRDATAGKSWFKTSFAQLVGRVGTFALVCIAWVYFRAADLPTAWRINRAMFGFGGTQGARGDEYVAVVVVAMLVATHIVGRDKSWEDLARKVPMPVAAFSLAVMLLFILSSAGGRAFVYFQF